MVDISGYIGLVGMKKTNLKAIRGVSYLTRGKLDRTLMQHVSAIPSKSPATLDRMAIVSDVLPFKYNFG